MDIVNMPENVSTGAKPCILWGMMNDIYVREEDGTLRGMVTIDGLDEPVDAGFYFSCQHWIYNRNIPEITAADTGYSSFCLEDPVMIYLGPNDAVIVGVYDDTFTDIITHQPCWPIFDPAKSFAVAPLSLDNSLNTWRAPFIGTSNLPFDFVNPFTDSFGEARPLGTYGAASSALGRHIRLITEHQDELGNQVFIAHTMHEAFLVLPTGVFLSPATTENSRYFLGRKLTYNSTTSQFIIDDIARVSGIIDNGSLKTISIAKDGTKVYIGTFSKVLDRIATTYPTGDVLIELKVGYFESGRIDHLFCMQKLVESGGIKAITALPEYSSAQTDSVTIQRDVFCVQNVGPAVLADTDTMRLLFYGFGSEPAGVARNNYDVLVAYDHEAERFGTVTAEEQSPYLWEANTTGGNITQTIYWGPGYPYQQIVTEHVEFPQVVMDGPDYPSVIGGDHVFTAGLYGNFSGDFLLKNQWGGSSPMRISQRAVTIDHSVDSFISYKHDGQEITRAVSFVLSDIAQVVDFDPATNRITGDSASFLSSFSIGEVHWFVVRPDLELYVFAEVQVFDNHTPLQYPPAPVSAKYYVWYRGEKTLLSESSTSFPATPTTQEYYQYLDMLGFPSGISMRVQSTNIASYFGIKAGSIVQPSGGDTYDMAIDLPGWPGGSAESFNAAFNIFSPEGYTLGYRCWEENRALYQGWPPNFNFVPESSFSEIHMPEGYRNAGGCLIPKFKMSPVLNEAGTAWISPLNIYNANQVYKQYPDHWSWLAESNEINQSNYGIGSDNFSAPRVFTYQRMDYKAGVTLGDPMFFGDHIYVAIPDVFTTGLVHEFFSGPADMLDKIKSAINPDDPDDVVFTTNVA